jgi:hypothetical protein
VVHPSFLIAPTIAISFLALCTAKNVGPGAFLLSLVLLGLLAVAQPLIQFGLINWREKPCTPWTARTISFFAALSPVVAAIVVGSFNFA